MMTKSPLQPVTNSPTMADATELRNHLKVANSDLDELQVLLAGASDALLSHFHGAAAELKEMLRAAARFPQADASRLHVAMDHLSGAITTLQFQDVGADLVERAQQRMRHCIDRLGHDPMNSIGRVGAGKEVAAKRNATTQELDTQADQLA
jgi:hypothetical protein